MQLSAVNAVNGVMLSLSQSPIRAFAVKSVTRKRTVTSKIIDGNQSA